jgi:predicted RNA-binding protein with PIN domain
MAYLIDGNNLIGHLFPLDIKNPQSRHSLLHKLIIFQKIKKSRITVVFDGPPDSTVSNKDFPQEFFSILYPPDGENADMVIKRIIEGKKNLRNYFVVSSDRDILSFARKKGAQGLNCKEFNRQLKSAAKENKKKSEMEKNTADPSPLEVDHWTEIFKSKK